MDLVGGGVQDSYFVVLSPILVLVVLTLLVAVAWVAFRRR
jgi:hypothetical protein